MYMASGRAITIDGTVFSIYWVGSTPPAAFPMVRAFGRDPHRLRPQLSTLLGSAFITRYQNEPRTGRRPATDSAKGDKAKDT